MQPSTPVETCNVCHNTEKTTACFEDDGTPCFCGKEEACPACHPSQPAGWEKEFEKEFQNHFSVTPSEYYGEILTTPTERVKQFIRSLLAREKVEARRDAIDDLIEQHAMRGGGCDKPNCADFCGGVESEHQNVRRMLESARTACGGKEGV